MTVLDHVPVDRITVSARDVEFRRTLLALFAGFFYVLGWSAGKVFTVAWFILVWIAIAARVGWQDARHAPTAPPRN